MRACCHRIQSISENALELHSSGMVYSKVVHYFRYVNASLVLTLDTMSASHSEGCLKFGRSLLFMLPSLASVLINASTNVLVTRMDGLSRD